jgi:two-component system chemotaxis sensor kinase CheA
MAEGQSGGRGPGTPPGTHRGESPADKAREDFFSEAQELADGLSRDLLVLDELSRKGQSDPELVNDVFRAVHTLKGLAGLFGASRMSAVSHELEEVLDDLRLGRIELTARVLDVLFQSVEIYGLLLAAERGQAPEPAGEVEALLVALGETAHAREQGTASPLSQYDLDASLLGVLTEYEEHRLRTNVQAGLSLFRIRVQFSLSTIDSALEDLKAKARPHGELITYLPTGGGGGNDSIELEIILASQASLEVLKLAISGPNTTLEEIKKRTLGSGAPSGGPQGASVNPAVQRAGHSLKAPSPPPQRLAVGDLSEGASDAKAPPGTAPPPTRRPNRGAALGASASEAPSIGVPSSPAPASAPTSLAPAHASIAPRAQGPTGSGSGAGRDLSLRSVSQTVRVDIRKLDLLMNIVGELAIVRTGLGRVWEEVRGRTDLHDLGVEIYRIHRALDRHLTQMQNGILEVRMVPLGQIFEKLARVARQISREHDKQVNLVITGAETEIDKLIVEELSDPLMHMIRNAIDHGIESRDVRLSVGKPLVGTIALNAFQKGNHVILEIEDDGAGMNHALLVETAVRRGILSSQDAAALTAREAYNLVFLPGFTTREAATDLSGRGVGMDVVKTNIAKLGGVVDIASEDGIGTTITVTLPITLAIISVLGVEVAGHSFAVPLSSVEEAIVLDESLVKNFDGREALTQRGSTLPICRLAQLFGLSRKEPAPSATAPRDRPCVVIAQVGERRLGFVVDRLVGQRDIVIKPLGRSLSKVRGFAGATELGDQRVGLLLDVASLMEEVLAKEKDRHMAHEGRA